MSTRPPTSSRDSSHPDQPELAPDDEGWIWLPLNAFPKAFAQQGTAEVSAVSELPLLVIGSDYPSAGNAKRSGPASRTGPSHGS
jgi:hypothetical protein